MALGGVLWGAPVLQLLEARGGAFGIGVLVWAF